MNPKVNHRRLAVQQRQHLKQLGYTNREIQAFAQIFTSPDTHEHAGLGCAADLTAAEAGNKGATR
jgi:hypothetical protein